MNVLNVVCVLFALSCLSYVVIAYVRYSLVESSAEAYLSAIRAHRDAKAEDRCWLNDMELYDILPEGSDDVDLSVGDKRAMLENCRRYVENRCLGGGEWPSYVELENEVNELRRAVAEYSKRYGSL